MGSNKQPEVGSVYSIKLPSSKYAFGRVMQDGGFQVFNLESTERNAPIISRHDVRFSVSMYFDAYKDKRMNAIGVVPFETRENSWPPKTYMYNPVTESYSIYYMGNITPAKKAECIGLEQTSAWELDHIIDRIMGDDRWVNKLGIE